MDNDNIRQLTVAAKHKEPNDKIIAHLEDALKKARTGEVQSVVMVFECTDGYEQHICTAGADRTVLLGMLSRLGHRINQKLDEDFVLEID